MSDQHATGARSLFAAARASPLLTNLLPLFLTPRRRPQAKKILSANPEAQFAIESLMNDIDVKANLTRDQFEEWAKSILDRVLNPMKAALADSGAQWEGIQFMRGPLLRSAHSAWGRQQQRNCLSFRWHGKYLQNI